MLDRPTRLTADEEALLRGLWVNGKRLADVAVEIGLSERQTARKLKAAGVVLPGRGRPKGVKDGPFCDRQRNKLTRGHGEQEAACNVNFEESEL